jgi:hypothetical protein
MVMHLYFHRLLSLEKGQKRGSNPIYPCKGFLALFAKQLTVDFSSSQLQAVDRDDNKLQNP